RVRALLVVVVILVELLLGFLELVGGVPARRARGVGDAPVGAVSLDSGIRPGDAIEDLARGLADRAVLEGERCLRDAGRERVVVVARRVAHARFRRAGGARGAAARRVLLGVVPVVIGVLLGREMIHAGAAVREVVLGVLELPGVEVLGVDHVAV